MSSTKKEGGIVARYSAEPFFAFHSIGAYEDTADGSIVVDLPWMKNYTFLEAARVKNLRANVGRPNGTNPHDLPATFRRYRLPNVLDQAQGDQPREAVFDFELPFGTCNIELPVLNDAYRLKPSRYAYGIHVEKPGFLADSLVKIDNQQRKSLVYVPKTETLCSEPIFVASPNPTSEDDGVLLSVVMDSTKRKSSMVVVAAKQMTEIGRANMPFVMGYGFHATYAAA